MNQRLVWNFEFCPATTLPLTSLGEQEKEEIKWEIRYFWPDRELIVLNTIDNALLNLGHYERKFKNDYYYLLPDNDFNIKLRRNEMQYKPLVQTINNILGFGHKVILQPHKEDKDFVPHFQKIINQIKTVGKGIVVNKESYIYKFHTNPPVKLELSRLEIYNTVYFSACVEGKSHFLVATISQHLLGNQVSCDYVNFLKKIVKS